MAAVSQRRDQPVDLTELVAHDRCTVYSRQAAEALRSLIGEIVLTPGETCCLINIELRGALFGILDFVKGEENRRDTGFMLPVAARPATKYKKAPNRNTRGACVILGLDSYSPESERFSLPETSSI